MTVPPSPSFPLTHARARQKRMRVNSVGTQGDGGTHTSVRDLEREMCGRARLGTSGCGSTRRVRSGRGWARHSAAGTARLGLAGRDGARLGVAELGKVWLGMAGLGVARRGAAQHGMAGLDRMVPRSDWGHANTQQRKARRPVTTKTTTNGPAPAGAIAPAPAIGDMRAIEIPRLDMRPVVLKLEGITPLIQHAWSEKARKQLEDSQTGKANKRKAPRVPEQEWRAAAYVILGREELADWQPGKYYHPASAFRHAFLYGVTQLNDSKRIPKTQATGWVFIDRDPELQFDSVTLRTDIGRSPTQPIYRPQFNKWMVDLHVSYNAGVITDEQVLALFDLGGFCGGIGEWRPSSPKNKSGSYGRFRVVGIEVLG